MTLAPRLADKGDLHCCMPHRYGARQGLSQRELSTEHQDGIGWEQWIAFQSNSKKLAITQCTLGNRSCLNRLAL